MDLLHRESHQPTLPHKASIHRTFTYFQYFAIPGNIPALSVFRDQVTRHWHQSLRRRSQRHRLTWDRFGPLVKRYLPGPRVLHSYPNDRFYAKHPK